MKRALLLCVAFGVLAVPASASAGTYLNAAAEYWGQPVPPGTTINHVEAWAWGGSPAAALRDPRFGISVIFLREPFWTEGMSQRWRCQLIVHEVGHLLGHPHSNDPGSVMYEGGAYTHAPVPSCDRLVRHRWHRWLRRHRRASPETRLSKRLGTFGID